MDIDQRAVTRNHRLAGLFVSLILLGSVVGIVVPAGIKWDFGNFYDAGRRILAGEFGNLYDPHSLIGGKPPQATTGFWGAPLSAYLNVPIALFEPTWGMMLFKLQTAAFNIASLVLLYRHNRRFIDHTPQAGARFAALFWFVALIYQPLWTTFRTGGQTTPVVFLFLVLSLLAAVSIRPLWSALYFICAVLVKPALITAIAVFGLLAGLRFMKSLVFIGAMTAVVSLVLCGWYIHERFLSLMLEGLKSPVPWFWNSSLYVTFENLKLLAPAGSWPTTHQPLLELIRNGLRLVVAGTLVVLVYRSRSRAWPDPARQHFYFLIALCFFLLLGHIVWESYLTFLFIVLAYLISWARHFSTGARVLIGLIVFMSFWQNIIWVDLLRQFVAVDSVGELVAVGLVKSAPLILLLVWLWRYHRELFATYETAVWRQELGRAPAFRGA